MVIYGVDEMHDQTITHSGEDLCLQWAVPRKFAPSGVLYLPRLSDHYLVSEFHCLSRPATPIDATQQTLLDWRAASVLLNLLKLALARADDQPGETHVVKAEEFIQSRFKVIRSINEVAAYVHLSPTHLRYLFKKLRGITLINYLTEVRVERARSLLTYSGLPLKQIATECGFSDEYYFSTVFQRHTHVPPGKFRRGG